MPSDSQGDRLPFEPRKKKKKSDSVGEKTAKVPAKPKKTLKMSQNRSTPRSSRPNANLSAIPDVVSKRMGRRMAIFCGIPSVLGMSSLFIFYWLKVKGAVDLPPYLAFAVSIGFLGLGVLGLSYGLFSASWDEERTGSAWGTDEFKVNLGRTRDAWKASKAAKSDRN